MERLDLSNCLVYLTDNAPSQVRDNLKSEVERWMDRVFLPGSTFRQLVSLWQQRHGFDGTIMLLAPPNTHRPEGRVCSPKWLFSDGQQVRSVQFWVRHLDGQAGVVVLCLSNGNNYEVQSNSSLIIHPRSSISELKRDQRQCPVRLFVPGHGYADSYTKRRRIIAELQAELRTNGRQDR